MNRWQVVQKFFFYIRFVEYNPCEKKFKYCDANATCLSGPENNTFNATCTCNSGLTGNGISGACKSVQESKVILNEAFSCCACFLHVHRPCDVILTYGQISSSMVCFFVYQKVHEKASGVVIDSLALSIGKLWPKLPRTPKIFAFAILSE